LFFVELAPAEAAPTVTPTLIDVVISPTLVTLFAVLAWTDQAEVIEFKLAGNTVFLQGTQHHCWLNVEPEQNRPLQTSS
jgi:hypothetical protein